MFHRTLTLAAALCLLAGCAELESDKFQAHRDALQRGENPEVRTGSKEKSAKKPAKKKHVEEDEDEDDDAEERQKAKFLSVLDRLSETDD